MEVAERLLQPPPRVGLGERLTEDARRDLDGGLRPVAHRRERRVESFMDELAVAFDVPGDVDERLAVSGQREPGPALVGLIQRVQKLADRIGRPAIVEEQRDASEHVVAGQQQPSLLLEHHDVRRCVPGRLVDGPDPEISLDLDAGHERTIGLDHPRYPRGDVLGVLGVAAERGLGHATLTPHLEPARERQVAVARGRESVLVVGVHPELAARPVADRRRLPPVIGMRVSTRDQAHLVHA
jgi:hypothetical protein